MELLTDFARVMLAVTFAIAAIAKVRNPTALIARFTSSGFGRAASPAAYAVAIIEGGVAWALLGGMVLSAAIAASVLLLAFSIWILIRPTSSGCGCGLPGEGLARWQLLTRNGVLAVAAMLTVGREPENAVWLPVTAVVATLILSAAALAGQKEVRSRRRVLTTEAGLIGGLHG